MRIAVDAMGGDHAPGEIVRGAVEAVREGLAEIILVGNEEIVRAELAKQDSVQGISVHHASEVVDMGEHPAGALRRKKDASITVATRLVKDGAADGLVSAGSTGAQMSAALLGLGRIKGVQRPAIAQVLPTIAGKGTLVLDVGANTDCKPQNLLEFARMGSLYSEKVLGVTNPRVALLNIGQEETKGNELTLAAFELLKQAGLNFTGNLEARDLFQGEADVVVCDGFVGNSMLKLCEGLITTLFQMIQAEMAGSVRTKIGAALMLPGFRSMKNRLDYAEYGGAPLLGVQGVSIISHGSSKARAIKNAVRVAAHCVQNRFVHHIETTWS